MKKNADNIGNRSGTTQRVSERARFLGCVDIGGSRCDYDWRSCDSAIVSKTCDNCERKAFATG